MRRQILCFGDSNTYGYCADPADCADGGTRFSEEERWTGRLQAALGPAYRIIEEGLPGRTTVFEDPVEEGLRGLDYLVPCLKSHAPVDLLVVMLGTNDVRACFNSSPVVICRGMERLLRLAQQVPCWGPAGPKFLLLPPAPLPEAVERSGSAREVMGPGCAEKSRALPELYRRLAEQLGCGYFDPAPYVEYNAVDHMHLTRRAHARLAETLVPAVTGMG